MREESGLHYCELDSREFFHLYTSLRLLRNIEL
jgi:hypothetical protein